MMTAALKKLLEEGFSAKDIERLRISAEKPEEKRQLATEIDTFLHRAAVTLLPPQRAALWFQIGEAYREGGASDEACRCYRFAVSEDPTHIGSARAWLDLAEHERRPIDMVEAMHARILQLRKPGHEEQRIALHRQAAHVLRDEIGDPTRAFFELLRAAKLAMRDDGLWQETIDLADAAQTHRELAAVLEDLAGKQTDTHEEKRFLRRVHTLAAGPLGDAAWAKRITLHLNELPEDTHVSTSTAADLTRALVDLDELRTTESRLRRAKRFPELLQALAQHELALPLQSHERSDVILTQALLISSELDEPERAFTTAERALREDTHSIGAHRFLIDLSINESWFERAVSACERFADSCEAHALDAILLACELSLERLNDEGRAKRAFELARALDPTHPGVETFAKRFG